MTQIYIQFLIVYLIVMTAFSAYAENVCDRFLNRADERLEFQNVMVKSPTLDRLDLFSSSATMRPLLFSKQIRPETLSWLRIWSAKSEIRLAKIFDKSTLRAKSYRYLRFFESRFWIAAQMIRFQSTPDPLQIQATFFEMLAEYVSELKSGNLISKSDFEAISMQLLSPNATYVLEQGPVDVQKDEFQTSILSAFHEALAFEQLIKLVSENIRRRLDELPVGLSFGLTDFTASVRFGDMQFFSSWWTPKLKSREAFLRKSEGDGAIDFIFKMTAFQKRQVALLLDRTDDELDPIFGPEKKQIGNDWQTCGTFARSVFNRCGVKIFTPVRYVASPTVLSLWIQHKLGLGPVQTVEISGMNRRLLVNGLSDIVFHDTIPAAAEFAAYCLATPFALTEVIAKCF